MATPTATPAPYPTQAPIPPQSPTPTPSNGQAPATGLAQTEFEARPHRSDPAYANHLCANGVAVPAGDEYDGLFIDCVALLEFQEAITSETELPWTVDIAVRRWLGIELGGSPLRVQKISLRDRQLDGYLSPSIGQLDGLVELHLQGNQITGPLPPEMGNLRNLNQVWLQHNRLTGPIPPELGNLSNLVYLFLHVNRLTGPIPSTFSELSNLKELDVGQNGLSGPIPAGLGRLGKLEKLHMGANLFNGVFPAAIADLPRLRSIDVGANPLSGCIPDNLREMNPRMDSIFCSEMETLFASAFPPFRGGPDLGIKYIERLPRYPSYRVVYHGRNFPCPYPYDVNLGPALCPHLDGLQYWPEPGDAIELIAHIQNFGDAGSGPFQYRWELDGFTVSEGTHDGLASWETDELKIKTSWPEPDHDPVLVLSLDPNNAVAEVIEENNSVSDWITGHPMGFSFTPFAYTNIREPQQPGPLDYSPEYWLHSHIARLNKLLAEADVRTRVRIDTIVISEYRDVQKRIPHRDQLDGWWSLLTDRPNFHDGATEHPDIDNGLLHELMHQLGVIDLYQFYSGAQAVQVKDVNRPGMKAGCGPPYFPNPLTCFRHSPEVNDMMATGGPRIGIHTAGGLRSNHGHRRGYYGDYLFDTPDETVVRIVDERGSPLHNVRLRFYQFKEAPGGRTMDDTPEIDVFTGRNGMAVLPNTGITGVATKTGHQLRPNPFGIIDVVGRNAVFLIEMTGACTEYNWLPLSDLNLAYWAGETDRAVFTRTLQCP